MKKILKCSRLKQETFLEELGRAERFSARHRTQITVKPLVNALDAPRFWYGIFRKTKCNITTKNIKMITLPLCDLLTNREETLTVLAQIILLVLFFYRSEVNFNYRDIFWKRKILLHFIMHLIKIVLAVFQGETSAHTVNSK